MLGADTELHMSTALEPLHTTICSSAQETVTVRGTRARGGVFRNVAAHNIRENARQSKNRVKIRFHFATKI